MTLIRRTAITGTLVTAALATVPLKTAANSRLERRTGLHRYTGLVLYGDGIHDDTAPLQAVLNGQYVFCTRPPVDGRGPVYMDVSPPRLTGGPYLISQTLFISRPYTQIAGCTIHLTDWTKPWVSFEKLQRFDAIDAWAVVQNNVVLRRHPDGNWY